MDERLNGLAAGVIGRNINGIYFAAFPKKKTRLSVAQKLPVLAGCRLFPVGSENDPVLYLDGLGGLLVRRGSV